MGKLKATRGKKHKHLGMILNCSKRGKVKVDVIEHIQDTIDTCPTKFKPTDTAPSPSNSDPFKVDNSPKLGQEGKDTFHTLVAKCSFVCERARPNMHKLQ